MARTFFAETTTPPRTIRFNPYSLPPQHLAAYAAYHARSRLPPPDCPLLPAIFCLPPPPVTPNRIPVFCLRKRPREEEHDRATRVSGSELVSPTRPSKKRKGVKVVLRPMERISEEKEGYEALWDEFMVSDEQEATYDSGYGSSGHSSSSPPSSPASPPSTGQIPTRIPPVACVEAVAAPSAGASSTSLTNPEKKNSPPAVSLEDDLFALMGEQWWKPSRGENVKASTAIVTSNLTSSPPPPASPFFGTQISASPRFSRSSSTAQRLGGCWREYRHSSSLCDVISADELVEEEEVEIRSDAEETFLGLSFGLDDELSSFFGADDDRDDDAPPSTPQSAAAASSTAFATGSPSPPFLTSAKPPSPSPTTQPAASRRVTNQHLTSRPSSHLRSAHDRPPTATSASRTSAASLRAWHRFATIRNVEEAFPGEVGEVKKDKGAVVDAVRRLMRRREEKQREEGKCTMSTFVRHLKAGAV
ncbi:hypothetical protein JCM8097_003123 [Rhodosporidiobolus ruineniae]